jgi:subtilisin family serine protease
MLPLASHAASAALVVPAVPAQYVPGEMLVKFKPAVSAQSSRAAVAAIGGAVQATLSGNLMLVKLPAGQDAAAAASAYSSDPNVEYAQPNYIYQATAVPNDTDYSSLWAFKNNGLPINTPVQGGGWIYTTNNPGTAGNDMNLEPAWNHITDCSSVVVAVLDSGVNYNQQDLAANMWTSTTYPNHGYNYVSGEGAANDPMDLNGHGTHVAGIIGAVGNNGTGVTGVCWKAKIMAVRVLDSQGSGTTASIISGMGFAVTNGAKVINMSLGGAIPFDQAYSDAITTAMTSDVVVVVAAGNDTNNNDTSARYPCNFTHANLVCVAALDQNFALATFSDWGATSVDVGAPGTNMWSTWTGTNTTITDTMNAAAAWTMTGGWNYMTWLDGSLTSHNGFADPGTWPTGTYPAAANDSAYKSFDLSAYDTAVLNFWVAGVVNSTDGFRAKMNTVAGDPFATGGTFLFNQNSNSNVNWYFDTTTVSGFSFIPVTSNISSCKSVTCTIGFNLTSAAGSTGAKGPMVTNFTIDTLTVNATSYNTENGTSMASPAVAGLAAMLRAYNPQYTYADVVASIKNSGRSVASLAGKTTTGKAVDATAALAYVNKPTGLSATVQ